MKANYGFKQINFSWSKRIRIVDWYSQRFDHSTRNWQNEKKTFDFDFYLLSYRKNTHTQPPTTNFSTSFQRQSLFVIFIGNLVWQLAIAKSISSILIDNIYNNSNNKLKHPLKTAFIIIRNCQAFKVCNIHVKCNFSQILLSSLNCWISTQSSVLVNQKISFV